MFHVRNQLRPYCNLIVHVLSTKKDQTYYLSIMCILEEAVTLLPPTQYVAYQSSSKVHPFLMLNDGMLILIYFTTRTVSPFTPVDVIGHCKQFSSSTWLSRKWPIVDGLKPFGYGQIQNIQALLWKVLDAHITPLGLPKRHLMNTF